MSYRIETVIDDMQKNHEEMVSKSLQFEGRGTMEVRKAAITVLRTMGHRNEIYDIKLDGPKWEIFYDNTLPFSDRPVLEQFIAERLQLRPMEVKLVGIGRY